MQAVTARLLFFETVPVDVLYFRLALVPGGGSAPLGRGSEHLISTLPIVQNRSWHMSLTRWDRAQRDGRLKLSDGMGEDPDCMRGDPDSRGEDPEKCGAENVPEERGECVKGTARATPGTETERRGECL
ncbi:hypothetical protein DQX05_19845 [Paenibacillus thiaminolyticus]|uniref:Uncharacterized protein n=1 Tax=Paenibacillus thiaminolyticus TaxID=49283 RepID=A0A3A3GVM5_PANTH|nr:hypothetical protein DQX05_19845 [Paenibacillus thiaminolyticus]